MVLFQFVLSSILCYFSSIFNIFIVNLHLFLRIFISTFLFNFYQFQFSQFHVIFSFSKTCFISLFFLFWYVPSQSLNSFLICSFSKLFSYYFKLCLSDIYKIRINRSKSNPFLIFFWYFSILFCYLLLTLLFWFYIVLWPSMFIFKNCNYSKTIKFSCLNKGLTLFYEKKEALTS